jgi:hypothetical protein
MVSEYSVRVQTEYSVWNRGGSPSPRIRVDHLFSGVSRIFFWEMEDTVVNDTKDRKQVFLIEPVSSV